MNLSVLVNQGSDRTAQVAAELLVMAGKMGFRIHMSKKAARAVAKHGKTPKVHTFDTEREAMSMGEITIAIGGDGTILRAARLVREIRHPLLGINSGRLGFLANVQQQHMKAALVKIMNGDYQLDQRHFIQAEFSDGSIAYALNEFVFSRKGTVSMITLTAEYDGSLINRYWADGIIVSSPTGSTAYNLSTGGPIVLPRTNVMVLTPISPHTLTTRPLVLSSQKNLTIKVEPANQKVLFSGDGANYDLPDNDPVVHIRQSDQDIHLIKLSGQSYFQTLREKLMWGADIREKSESISTIKP
ncbi:NAD(+)/NADH kinase [Balneolales bacterium ANBcel1]|nr:NAD(+)/NADH kinase [Balneolales bacterium ANBcel1]